MNTQDIEQSLSILEHIYNSYTNDSGNPNNYNITLVSKLALLELGGWLEETNDLLIEQSINRIEQSLSIQQNQSLCEEFQKVKKDLKTKIQNTHGFDYKTHLKPMLIHLLGSIALLKIEKNIGFSNINSINSKLKNLHKVRGIMAHRPANQAANSIKNNKNQEMQQYITSPSVLKQESNQLNNLFLQPLEKELNQYCSQFDFSS